MVWQVLSTLFAAGAVFFAWRTVTVSRRAATEQKKWRDEDRQWRQEDLAQRERLREIEVAEEHRREEHGFLLRLVDLAREAGPAGERAARGSYEDRFGLLPLLRAELNALVWGRNDLPKCQQLSGASDKDMHRVAQEAVREIGDAMREVVAAERQQTG